MAKRGRRPVRQTEIAAQLRQQIIRGRWAAGQQIPSQLKLARQFAAPPLTVRRAIARLVSEGFLQTQYRRGRFVCDRLPHEHRYALVVPRDPADLSTLWSRFYSTLVNEAPAVARAARCEIIPFYGLDNGPRAADYARLADWCATGSIAGIIFARHPYHLIGTPILEQPGIPRVALMSECQFPQVPAVAWDGLFFSKACAWLAARGRRKLAVLMPADELQRPQLARQAAGSGLELRPAWQLPMTPYLLEAGAAYVGLLLDARKANRPDAVVVGDDNYVESVLAGLQAAGVGLGTDLDVVTQCNFPWAGTLPPQVQKIGYSAHAALETCLQLLDRQRRGDTVPAVTTLEAKFENEGPQPLTGRDLAAQPVGIKEATT